MSILSVQDISKSFKLRKVVKTLSLEIKSGEVVGLLKTGSAFVSPAMSAIEMCEAHGGTGDDLITLTGSTVPGTVQLFGGDDNDEDDNRPAQDGGAETGARDPGADRDGQARD